MMPKKNEDVCSCGYKEESTGSTTLSEKTSKKSEANVKVVEEKG